MPGTRPEAGRDVGEGEDQQGHAELDQHWHEEQTREVDETDHVDGKLRDNNNNISYSIIQFPQPSHSHYSNMNIIVLL